MKTESSFRRKNRIRAALSTGVVILACATLHCGMLISGRSHDYRFESTPPGAEVTVYVAQNGVTGSKYYGDDRPVLIQFMSPGTTNINMDSLYVVEFKLAGHKTVKMSVGKKFNYWSVLNLWSWPCWLVDAFSGGMYVPDNDGRIWVTLVPGDDAEQPVAMSVEFVVQRGAGPRLGTQIALEPGDGEVNLELTDAMLRPY